MALRFHFLILFCTLAHTLTYAVCAEEKVEQSSVAKPSVDLRPEFEKRKLKVRQQGERGSCQVFAMVGVIEYQLAQRENQVDLSEQYIMWAANQANRMNRTEGFNPDFLFAGLKKHGICDESQMPYVAENQAIENPADDAIRHAMNRKSCKMNSIKHWSSDIGFTKKDIKRITDRLDQGTPVTATLCWPIGPDDQEMVDAQHFMIDKEIDGESKNGHGVILVGYGLDEKMDGGGYFIFRNSWGPIFADLGYAYITFAFAKKYGTDAYIVSLREPIP